MTCGIPFYRAGSSPAYLCAKLKGHGGFHGGDMEAFPFPCYICSVEAPYRCLGCESNFCRVHMIDHVDDTQLMEAERHLKTASLQFEALNVRYEAVLVKLQDAERDRSDCEAAFRALQKQLAWVETDPRLQERSP